MRRSITLDTPFPAWQLMPRLNQKGNMKTSIEIDLDVATPEEVSKAIREIASAMSAAADKYAESPSELSAAWGDPNAGQVWRYLSERMAVTATMLERRADLMDETVARYV